MIKTVRYIFGLAGGVALGSGASLVMESRPYLGGVSIILGASFLAAVKVIKYHEEKKFTPLIPLPTEKPEIFTLTGETEKEFKERLMRALMKAYGDDENKGDEETVCRVEPVICNNTEQDRTKVSALLKKFDR